ncbi:MAG: hypothetical protein IPM54_41200 [Polyangiaceae bacterium]|nr:hypothetical protein [Polyangiaceae bacterium]
MAHLDVERLAPSSLDVAMAAIVIELRESLCPQTIPWRGRSCGQSSKLLLVGFAAALRCA